MGVCQWCRMPWLVVEASAHQGDALGALPMCRLDVERVAHHVPATQIGDPPDGSKSARDRAQGCNNMACGVGEEMGGAA